MLESNPSYLSSAMYSSRHLFKTQKADYFQLHMRKIRLMPCDRQNPTKLYVPFITHNNWLREIVFQIRQIGLINKNKNTDNLMRKV